MCVCVCVWGVGGDACVECMCVGGARVECMCVCVGGYVCGVMVHV